MTNFSVKQLASDADVKLARFAGLSTIFTVVNFAIDGYDNAYRVIVFGRGLKYVYQKTMLLIINDQIKGKMTAPWKEDPIDWSETPIIEWFSDCDQREKDLLSKGLAVVQPIEGHFMLLSH
jgi:hypothetical protein